RARRAAAPGVRRKLRHSFGTVGRIEGGAVTRSDGRITMNDKGHADCAWPIVLVPGARFELARVSPYAPQTYVSTNSTTRARVFPAVRSAVAAPASTCLRRRAGSRAVCWPAAAPGSAARAAERDPIPAPPARARARDAPAPG